MFYKLYKNTLDCLKIIENYFISFTKCRKIIYLFRKLSKITLSCLENYFVLFRKYRKLVYLFHKLYQTTLACLEILENYFIPFKKCGECRKIVYMF
jgi:hypothetical protein